MPNPDPPVTVTAAEFARELVSIFESMAQRIRDTAAKCQDGEIRAAIEDDADAHDSVASIIKEEAARHGVKLEGQPAARIGAT